MGERTPARGPARTWVGVIPHVAVPIGLYALKSALLAMVLYHLGMALALALFRARPKARSLVEGGRWRSVLLLLPLFLSVGMAIYLGWPYARRFDGALWATLSAVGLGPLTLPLFALYYAVVNAPLEELFWRGLLTTGSARPDAGDLLFGSYHGWVMALFVSWPFVLLTVALLTGAAWFWRCLARRFGGLAIPFATHAAADVSIMVALFALAY